MIDSFNDILKRLKSRFVLLDFALTIKKKITEAGAYLGKESIDYPVAPLIFWVL